MKSKSSTKNNFKYSQDFLKRFNALRYENKPVSDQKILGKYNVWMFFQSRIFFHDLGEYAQEKKVRQVQVVSFRVKLQNFILSIFCVLVSFIAVMKAILYRKTVLLYGIDRISSNVINNDERMDPVYEYLKNNHLSFLECMHTTVDFSFVKRFFRRKRWVLYIKSLDILFYAGRFFRLIKRNKINIDGVNFSSFEPEEREYAKKLLFRYLSAIDLSEYKVRVLRKVLSWMNIKILFTIDNTRDYWEIILACHLNNIPIYAFQHGLFTKYHMGWLYDGSFGGEIVRPDKIFVWSEFWKREFIRLGTYFPEESIVVGGFNKPIIPASPRAVRNNICILIPYEPLSNKSEVIEYIDKFLSCGFTVFFKLRVGLDINRQIKEYGISKDYNTNLKFISNMEEYIAEVDVVAGTYSTLLYDMIAYERPIALLKTSSDLGEGMIENHLADSISLDHVYERIVEISNTPSEILKHRKDTLFGERPKLLYDTLAQLGASLNLK